MDTNEINNRLSSAVKRFVEQELSRKETLPENFNSVEVDVFESHYGKMCKIYFLFSDLMSGYEMNVMRPIEIIIKRNIKRLFGDIFEGGVYTSLEVLKHFKPRRIFKDDETPLLEYDRKPHEKKYEEEYEKMKKNFIRFFDTIIDAYYESDSVIHLYDRNENRIMSYYKDSKELYYSRALNDLIMDLMPHHFWMRHGQYAIADVFNSHFDNPVKYVTPAGMIN